MDYRKNTGSVIAGVNRDKRDAGVRSAYAGRTPGGLGRELERKNKALAEEMAPPASWETALQDIGTPILDHARGFMEAGMLGGKKSGSKSGGAFPAPVPDKKAAETGDEWLDRMIDLEWAAADEEEANWTSGRKDARQKEKLAERKNLGYDDVGWDDYEDLSGGLREYSAKSGGYGTTTGAQADTMAEKIKEDARYRMLFRGDSAETVADFLAGTVSGGTISAAEAAGIADELGIQLSNPSAGSDSVPESKQSILEEMWTLQNGREAAANGEKGYFEKSLNQMLLGNYTDDVTALGTAGQVLLGLAGLDTPADIRDLTYDLTNWEWTPGHVGQTLLDAVGFLPGIGVLKNADEAAAILKGVLGSTAAAAAAKGLFKSADELGAAIKSGVKNADEAGTVLKSLLGYTDEAAGVLEGAVKNTDEATEVLEGLAKNTDEAADTVGSSGKAVKDATAEPDEIDKAIERYWNEDEIASTPAAESAGETKLYRVMSDAEYQSIINNGGKFSTYDRAMEEKWFATSPEDAAKWAEKFYPDGRYRMIEVEVPTDSLNQMYQVGKLDGIGPAYSGGIDFFNSIMKGLRLK